LVKDILSNSLPWQRPFAASDLVLGSKMFKIGFKYFEFFEYFTVQKYIF